MLGHMAASVQYLQNIKRKRAKKSGNPNFLCAINGLLILLLYDQALQLIENKALYEINRINCHPATHSHPEYWPCHFNNFVAAF